ncbi:MAG: PhzF family phenazine biosynthesis protein [Rhizobiaceae bacterium]|nr:MAG: PhzF family phenazine biosynthesis protein [Rhizobiaceae bacterium]
MPVADFVTVDVFTDQRFFGNPLAVITDARGLSGDEMQAIATEFGYSETTFVLPPDNPANTARVRIFTPTTEVPFAGHPNVGTAFVLGNLPDLFGNALGNTLRFEEIAGLVEIDLIREGDVVVGATIRAPRPLELGAEIEPQRIADCASIGVGHVVTHNHAPVFASVGLPFAIAELDGLQALAAARPDLTSFHRAAEISPGDQMEFSLFLYVRDAKDRLHIRARMFAPLDNVPEDPATGSASAALGAFLAMLDPKTDADIRMTVEQGVEMGRRSVIELAMVKRQGRVTDVRISGSCVKVMSGRIEL